MIRDEDIPSIVAWAESVQTSHNPIHEDLLDVYEGNLKRHIEASMQREFNPNAFQAAKERISPINVLKRTTDKLAKVYSQGVERSAPKESDNSLISSYEEWLDLDVDMAKADSLVNLLRSCAFEPYIRKGVPQLRILTPNQFTVWSGDSHDKTNPTVFVKFMGSEKRSEMVEEQFIERDVNIYILYDEDEFIKVDSDNRQLERQAHDVGRIPFSYMNLSISQLVPKPDEDSYAMTVLIPKLLSDLNYASKYQSHGIRYGIDVDVSNLEGNPDAFWQISSADKEGAKPAIGVIAPSVDIDKVINLAKEELVMYLESRSLKVGSSGQFENNASGFAKLIDSADVTDVRKENMHTFKALEMDLWDLISILHNMWVLNELIDIPELNKSFSPDFKVSIKYGDLAPIVDPQEKRDNLKFKLDNKLTTRERAIREANPDLTKDEQDELIKELELEKENSTPEQTANPQNEVPPSVGPNVPDPDGEGSQG